MGVSRQEMEVKDDDVNMIDNFKTEQALYSDSNVFSKTLPLIRRSHPTKAHYFGHQLSTVWTQRVGNTST